VEVRGCDLVSGAKGQSNSVPERETTQDQSRSDKVLALAIVPPLLKEGRVELHLGPQFPKHSTLNCIIPKVGPSADVRISSWQSDTKGAL
jgi:hypothetical protein